MEVTSSLKPRNTQKILRSVKGMLKNLVHDLFLLSDDEFRELGGTAVTQTNAPLFPEGIHNHTYYIPSLSANVGPRTCTLCCTSTSHHSRPWTWPLPAPGTWAMDEEAIAGQRRAFKSACFDCCTLCGPIICAHANTAREMLKPGNTMMHSCRNACASVCLFQRCTPFCLRAHELAKYARCLYAARECSCQARPRHTRMRNANARSP